MLNGDGRDARDDIALLVLRVPELPLSPQAEVTRLLPSEPDAAALAREALDELEPMLADDVFATVRLLVSELVTNSVRHAEAGAGQMIELRATLLADRLRVEVTDRGAGFDETRRAPDRHSTSGWGLYIVDQLADSWGVVRDDATRVWFEIERGSGNRPAGA
ncbi:MAG TPA: ATP-binding protein [Thermoleophilaceae bacterium]